MAVEVKTKTGPRARCGGGRGIRTHETFLPTGFQDQLHRPLGQTSAGESI